MSKTLLKPRWDAWQNICLRKAFEEKIPLKIVSIAMGRTTTSVSKRIKNLGLRDEGKARGRKKGKKLSLLNDKKIHKDISKMTKILQNIAPLTSYRKGRDSLIKNNGVLADPPFSQKEKRTYGCLLEQERAPFSFPLEYILSKDHASHKTGQKVIFGDPFYVSLLYVEKWAASEGFHPVTGGLRKYGLSFWKDGKHFSKAQLLMYVNRIRYEKKLQPLALFEDEKILLEKLT